MNFKKLIIVAALALGFAGITRGADFPSTVSSDSTLLNAKNNCGTILTASVTSGATSLSVSDTSCFATVGYVTLDEEAILCTGKTATSFTGCTRGADGTTAVSHTNGTPAYAFIVAAHHNLLKNELVAISQYLLQGDQVHITTSSTPDMVGLGTSTPAYHMDIWDNGTNGPLAVSTSTTGSPKALAVNTSGNVTMNGSLSAGAGTFTSVTDSGLTSGRVPVAGSAGLLGDFSGFTHNGTTLTVAGLVNTGNATTAGNSTVTGTLASGAHTASSLTASSLTSGRVVTAGTGGLLQDFSGFTHNGTTLTVAGLVDTGSGTVAGSLSVTGALTGSTLDTGQGANELYAMNQNVQTGDSPTFAGATFSGLTASRAVQTNGSKALESSVVTTTELGYLSGVTSAIQTQISAITATPAGAIIMFASSTAPSGWYICDGSTKSRTTDATLYTAIGTTFGTGDGSTTFNLPDFRGVFPKGSGTTTRAAGVDASGNAYAGTLGTYSTDKFQGHYHSVPRRTDRNTASGGSDKPLWDTSGNQDTLGTTSAPLTDGTNGTPRTGHTTEPQSLGINFIIKS
jgi:microcystin-dependent protein